MVKEIEEYRMLTIFTPTYNRGNLLNRVYGSLKEQTVFDFEWLIVDDGSSDNTEEIVQKWIDEAIIKIRYIRKENGGKHTAFNTGVQNAKGELFFCVDSDDFTPNTCVESILKAWSDGKDDNIAGIVGKKTDTDGKFLCGDFPEDVTKTTMYDLAQEHQCLGEKSLVYKTDILKKYPYPEILGERFVTECVVYDRIDAEYTMLLLDEVLTVCEYQPDGLTGTIFPTMLKNPTGYKIYYKQRIDMAYTFKERLGYAVRYNAFDILSGDKKYNYHGKYRLLVVALKPLGWLLTKYYNFKKNK